LDGNASKASDGGLLNYAWQLVKHPENSTSALINSTTATPQLLPDRPGLYSVQLIVTDARNQASQPVNIEINAIAPVPKLQLKTSQSQYRIGQYLKVNVQPSEDGYLGIVYLSSTGEKLQIFPNGYQENSQVKAGKTYQVPPKKKPDMLQIQPPEGTDTIIAVFSKQRLPDLETHIASDGSITGLQQDVIVEQTQYQVIKN
jgi:hypothetical protein